MSNDKLQMTNEGKLLEERENVIQEEEGLWAKLNASVLRLGELMEKARIDEYTSMFTRPWRFFFVNFIGGIFRGFGIAVGMTIVAAIVLYVFAKVLVHMVDLPIIGMYIAELVKFVNQYIQQGVTGH
ncbi:hypothetical protein COT42_00250 [Candidatus Saganbacteria bacterium CG08_land_8_20_14_0_20_45_16]|uniref:Uncharacterized protein n=1 Tax=Candidatus Saganbacteria bacterium CG08_land_8_20_14_0_20_45_16 TaxID=2014293 RepID=A0A2H0Y470_UNCSA|nr:MAG: hypothetical protein COT42_00250 [Candidatus Saganbacteria bacterium CG08_land_8_20_14_0_20_45_16]